MIFSHIQNPHISKGCEKSYLLTMTANMCRNHLKSAANRLNSSYEELSSDSIASGLNIEEQSMYEALGKLPDTYRTVLYLHYYEGYTFKEIARMLHLSSSAVSMRISRGKTQLRELLSNE